MKKKHKLLLINPNNAHRSGIYHSEAYSVPPLNLGIVAALTPSHWEVEIWDENFKPFEYQEADFVGFTALTSQVSRAYEIAAMYRKNKIPTVLGGIHASMIPEEAVKYVDVVVKGEAESVWGQVILDFERKNLKNIYAGEFMDLMKSPAPRIDLYDPGYALGSLQTTRGCPMKCDFCSVHAINGHKYRQRSVEAVVEEFIRIPQDRIYVVDDDFYGYSKKSAERAKDICRGIINSGVRKDWYTFTSMHIASDEEVLKLMAESGCRVILLGIESEVTDQLMDSSKHTNLRIGVENYNKVFDTIRRNGIAVLGSFIFGLDSDTPESIRNRADFYINSSIDCIQAGILTPLPGTGTYYKMLGENRITHTNFPSDWEKYTFFHCVYEPKNMSQKELLDLMHESWERIYSREVLKRKYLNTLKTTRSPVSAGWALFANMNYHNSVFEKQKDWYPVEQIYKDTLEGKPPTSF
jgi:radical SAM superfamily enzyme YgiQ (UPF0313 family)